MSNANIPVPRASDATIISFFEEMKKRHQFPNISITVWGADQSVEISTAEAQNLKEGNRYAIQVVSTNRNQFSMSFTRDSQAGTLTPDRISVSGPSNQIPAAELISINALISEKFLIGATQSAAFLGDPKAFASVIESHQQIVLRLEESLERVSARFAAERLRIQSEQDAFIRQKQDEFNQREAQLSEELSKDRQALAAREKDLDDRTNMHARRGIRADLKKRLQEHATKFTLTEKTRHLRWPIHVVVWIAMAVLIGAIIYYSTQYDVLIRQLTLTAMDPKVPTQIQIPAGWYYPLVVKLGLLSIAALGLVTWYIRWMNRWFEQHATAEFNLKQFELDVDRASWVVETSMEWRASQNGVMPDILLKSISKNLFVRREQDKDERIHPLDYLASGILGKAARARIAIAGNEIELDRRSLKDIQKDK